MNKKILNALICTICKSSLEKAEKTYNCKQKHCFDIAKEGYVNLLLSNQKHSKSPGDSKDMLVARRNFLNKGYYKRLSYEINKTIFDIYKSDNKRMTIADIGCGEGYYLTNFIEDTGKKANLYVEAYGMDISKDAIKLAGKRNAEINWLVGNVVNLPFADNSLDFVLCMFSIVDFEECNRVLKDNGRLIFVSAGDFHLKQLKEIIYDGLTEAKESKLDKLKLKYFKNVELLKINYDILLSESNDIRELLKMTPHYWKIKEENREVLYQYSKLQVTVDIKIEILKK